MAAKSNLTNMVVCLTGVCLVCAALLGVVKHFTDEPIAEATKAANQKALQEVLPEGAVISDTPETVTVTVNGKETEISFNRAEADGKAYYAIAASAGGFGGELKLMVGVGEDSLIWNTAVLSCNETPGLGAKCTDSKGAFRTQFQKFDASDASVLKVKKDGGAIDAITASTITSRAFTEAVAVAVEAAKAIKSKEEPKNE